MAEQKQIQKKIRFALSSQTSKENLSFAILLIMSLVRTRLNACIMQIPMHLNDQSNYFCFRFVLERMTGLMTRRRPIRPGNKDAPTAKCGKE